PLHDALPILSGEQHAFVNQRAGGEAGHIPGLGAEEALVAQLGGGALADDVELAFEGELVGEAGGAADEDLADVGFAGPGGFAEGGVVGGHGAPAEEGLAFALDDLRELFLELAPVGGVAGEEDEAGAVAAGFGEVDAGLFGGLDAKGVGDLQEDSGAVAGVGLAAGGAAVVEVFEDLDALAKGLVGGAALEVGDKADAARVVFEPGVVEALLGGTAGGGLAGERSGGGGTRIIHGGSGSTGVRSRTAVKIEFWKTLVSSFEYSGYRDTKKRPRLMGPLENDRRILGVWRFRRSERSWSPFWRALRRSRRRWWGRRPAGRWALP